MSTYKRIVADGILVGVYKGDQPMWVAEKIKLKGIHVELSDKKEYDKYRRKRKKKEPPKENLLLPGWTKERGVIK